MGNGGKIQLSNECGFLGAQQGFFEGRGEGNDSFCHFSVEAEEEDAFRRPQSVIE